MNILIVSHYYPPDVAGRIPETVGLEMQSRGHNVRVVTNYPHYETGRISQGYKQRLRFEELLNGIPVRRVPIVPSHSRNPLGRMANYLSFVVTSRLAKDFVVGADVIYVHGTPATPVEPARVWSQQLGVPYVYHVQDIWPESVTESGFLPQRVLDLMKRGISTWLSRVYGSAAAVIAIGPTARELLVDRGVPEERAHLIYNWAERSGNIRRAPQEGLTLLYAGNLGEFQDLDTVVRAAKVMADAPGFRLLIAGSGVVEKQLKSLVAELRLETVVEFLGRVERERMPQLYAEADFQIVSLKDRGFFAGTVPSKLQAGLACGVPVITTVKGDVSRLVEDHHLGLVALPENADSLAAAYQAAYEMSRSERVSYSERADRFFDENFAKRIAMDSIEAILAAAVETRRDWKTGW